MSKPNFFSTGSPFLEHPLLTPERTSAEVDFVLAQAQVPKGSTILDVGCGPGRHSIELARRDYAAVGVDPSQAMIDAARKRAAEAGVGPEFIMTRGEDFDDPRMFDAAICLFTTFGQIDREGDQPHLLADHPLLVRIAGLVRPGGMFILESPQREWTAANLKAVERFGGGDRTTEVQRSYDPVYKTVTEIFNLISPGSTRQFILRYHLYARSEIERLLSEAGFDIVQAFGDFNGAPLTAESPNMLFTARLAGAK